MSSLWSAQAAAEATGGRSTRAWEARGVSIDTRSLVPGDLFVALTAARDGHDFVAQALDRGAAAALVSRIPEGVAADAPLLLVDDVQAALEALGRAGRARVSGKVLAITGSVGKTSTKEMARVAFGPQMRVHAAEASYNNHWGVPLTLARMAPETDLAIVEIGMSGPGEIAPLSHLAQPHAAVVTTVAPAHLAAFGDVAGIAREKAAVFEGVLPEGVAIWNADVPTAAILRNAAAGRTITFGAGEDADWRLSDASLHGDSTIVEASRNGIRSVFRLGGAGRHLALNALAVLAAAEALGFDPDLAAQNLAGWAPAAGRGRREHVQLDPSDDHGLELIDDAFNANPASVAAALDRLIAAVPVQGGRRIAILGDMLELGPDEAGLHADLSRHRDLETVDLVHTAGPLSRHLHEALPAEIRGEWFPEAESLAGCIGGLVRAGDVVLVKGSKSARTALVVDAIKKLGEGPRRPA